MAKRVAQDQQIYITRRRVQERWSCSHMFVERHVATDSMFPQYFRFGEGRMAQRRWILADIEQWERSASRRRHDRNEIGAALWEGGGA